MGRVILDMAMSLDGYIGGTNGEDSGLYDWYFADGVETSPSKMIIDELINGLGAIVMGRRTYDMSEEHSTAFENPYKMPHFVLTHRPQEAIQGATPYTFVTDGLESLLAQAQAAAGDKPVAIAGGAGIAHQFLKAGLIDEIQLHLRSVLLGSGLRLFEAGQFERLELERIRVVEAHGVTHIKYRINK